MQSSISFEDIRAGLQGRIRTLLSELAPGGYYQGDYYFVRNPTRADRKAGSFWIVWKGSACGAWREDAGCDKGDIIDLVGYLKGLPDKRAIRAWCLSWLGWRGDIDRRKIEAAKRANFYTEAQQAKEDQEQLTVKRRQALSLFLHARRDIRDTPVETYLATRGIDLSCFDKLPGAIRYLPEARYTDSDAKQSYWPCMLSAISGDQGNIIAVHRTFLDHDGKRKAPVEAPKKIWPAFKGGVIRISRGASRLTPEELMRRYPFKRETVVVTEGIENALTLALALPEYRVWASATLGNLANLPALKMISDLIIYADNDDNADAKAKFQSVLRQLSSRRFAIRVARAEHFYKDANDKLCGVRR